MEGTIGYILSKYDLNPELFQCERIGTGHIHDTYKLSGPRSFVLQKFNDKVFARPDIVENNLRLTAEYLKKHHPDYHFVAPIALNDGRTMIYDEHGSPWRLFNYVNGSFSIDEASTVDQAFKASAAFGRLGKLLRNCPIGGFAPAIDRFHDLSFRYKQLLEALSGAENGKKNEAKREIAAAEQHSFLVREFESIISKGILRMNVFHNDTKINNVLFDRHSNEVAAVVDLDTLMPGYFIYDLGDLVRTIVSPVSEEEADLTKVEFRSRYYDAVIGGYMSEMKDALTKEELKYVSFSGQMMTFIMALRFLADFLRGDTYYHTTYPGQNLVRARNQFRLLTLLVEHASRNK